jgi:hypothetical protein
VRLFSYVVARDFGFAPNPFYRVCTLATCKPRIRATASVGDWVVGTGSTNNKLAGHLVFAMKVEEILSFDEYWASPRFREKRPLPNGSVKQRYGDNIYHRDKKTNKWVQANSHHSFPDGSPNPGNIATDTETTDRVLIAHEYTYWGASGPRMPPQFRKAPNDLCCTTQGHKCNFDQKVVAQFVDWITTTFGFVGFAGAPAEFPKY